MISFWCKYWHWLRNSIWVHPSFACYTGLPNRSNSLCLWQCRPPIMSCLLKAEVLFSTTSSERSIWMLHSRHVFGDKGTGLDCFQRERHILHPTFLHQMQHFVCALCGCVVWHAETNGNQLNSKQPDSLHHQRFFCVSGKHGRECGCAPSTMTSWTKTLIKS